MKYYLEDVREVFKRTESSENGLSQSEAERRLEKYGKNKLAQAKQKSLVRRFFEQLADPMIIILIVAAVISAATTIYEGYLAGKMSFPTDTVITLTPKLRFRLRYAVGRASRKLKRAFCCFKMVFHLNFLP